jgi:hypothetical protein
MLASPCQRKRLIEVAGAVEVLTMNAFFGGPYSTHAKRVAMWNKAAPIPGCDKAIWRCDDQGRIIRWSDYQDRFSRYGWLIQRENWLSTTLRRPVSRPVHVSQAERDNAALLHKAA